MAGCETFTKVHEKVKRWKAGAPASLEVVVAIAWQAAGGLVTRKVEVVMRLNGLVGRERSSALKGMMEHVQALVKERKQTSWNVTAGVWMTHAADEVLWRITGVGRDTHDDVVVKNISKKNFPPGISA